ncbi:hypothetical protein EO238_24785, partial [Citrobacter sp. AAK_AS5]
AGQGTILASDRLADVRLRAGCDVKKSEIHGMAQRGGSVMSHVRYGRFIDCKARARSVLSASRLSLGRAGSNRIVM